jgi:hypothetical protein
MFVTNFGTATGNTASAIVRAVNSENTATTLNFPLAKKNFGSGKKTTTFFIQNAGSAATTITARMTILSGGPCTSNPKNFAPAVSEQVNFTPADLGCPAGTLGSLTVTSAGQPLAGIVLEADDSASRPRKQGCPGHTRSHRLIVHLFDCTYHQEDGQFKNAPVCRSECFGSLIPAGGLRSRTRRRWFGVGTSG